MVSSIDISCLQYNIEYRCCQQKNTDSQKRFEKIYDFSENSEKNIEENGKMNYNADNQNKPEFFGKGRLKI